MECYFDGLRLLRMANHSVRSGRHANVYAELPDTDAVLGEEYARANLWRDSRNSFTRAIHRSGTNAAALSGRALALWTLGYKSDAYEDATRSLELAPQHPLAPRAEFVRREFLRRAQRTSTPQRRVSAPHIALRQQGFAALEDREYEEAIEFFTRALEVRQSDARSLAGRAEALRKRHQYKRAIIAFGEAFNAGVENTDANQLAVEGMAKALRSLALRPHLYFRPADE